MTGSPSIASRISSKSICCTRPSSSRAAASSSSVWARIILRTTGRRSGARNMCSVRHSPMPSAPRRRAFSASSPVSALARTASLPLRTWSAHSQDHVELGRRLRVLEQHRAEHDGAGGAVERDDVALVHHDVADAEPVAGDLHRLGTDDRRRSPATGDDGGVRHETAAGGQDALGDHHAVDVFGARLVAHEHDLLAPLGGVGRFVSGEVHLAHGGTR